MKQQNPSISHQFQIIGNDSQEQYLASKNQTANFTKDKNQKILDQIIDRAFQNDEIREAIVSKNAFIPHLNNQDTVQLTDFINIGNKASEFIRIAKEFNQNLSQKIHNTQNNFQILEIQLQHEQAKHKQLEQQIQRLQQQKEQLKQDNIRFEEDLQKAKNIKNSLNKAINQMSKTLIEIQTENTLKNDIINGKRNNKYSENPILSYHIQSYEIIKHLRERRKNTFSRIQKTSTLIKSLIDLMNKSHTQEENAANNKKEIMQKQENIEFLQKQYEIVKQKRQEIVQKAAKMEQVLGEEKIQKIFQHCQKYKIIYNEILSKCLAIVKQSVNSTSITRVEEFISQF